MKNILVVASSICFILVPAVGTAGTSEHASTVARTPLREQKAIPGSAAAGKGRLASYGKLPLSFEANCGQTDLPTRFLARGPGYTLFLTQDSAQLSRKNQSSRPVRLSLIGADTHARLTGEGKLEGMSNYFIGRDPKRWLTNVPNYGRVTYRHVYPDIDLAYYGNQGGQLEFDFIVAPGADPAAIRFALSAPARIGANGELVVGSGEDELHLHKPLLYQTAANGQRIKVHGTYVLEARNEVRFQVSSWDRTRTLMIDPVLTWSTFQGGSGWDQGNALTIDSGGNAYITGQTSSINFPTQNPYQASNKANQTSGLAFNAYITKINSAGTALVYSTYIGGSGSDVAEAIAVDSDGNAYITGQTSSSDFPTQYPYQSYTGSPNTPSAFVTELNSSGSALVYSTFLGGELSEGLGIAADSLGNTFVAGLTFTAFPLQNPYQGIMEGPEVGFVTKMNFSGSALSLVYSTYLGGNNSTQARGIALDASGDAYVTGGTSSTSGFPTVNPLQASNKGNTGTAFVTEIAPTGTFLYSTYLGGSGGDAAFGIAVDSTGSAYITGATRSVDFPVLNPIQNACNSCTAGYSDAFITKLNSSGSALAYSTYLGGNYIDNGQSIAVDSSGDAYVIGTTGSFNFPVVNWIQQFKSPQNAFIAELNPAGSSLIFSTYLGAGGESGEGIGVDAFGNIYVGGDVTSSGFPVLNAIQTTYGGGSYDAFVAKLAPGVPAVTLSPLILAFGQQFYGKTSAAKTVTLTNTGTAPLLGVSISSTGEFAQTNDCGTSLGAGLKCTITVTFTPYSKGSDTGTLSIYDNASAGPQSVALKGRGLVPEAKLSASSLSFGDQAVDIASSTRPLTLTNIGNTALTISKVAVVSGEFTETNDCPNTLAKGATCTIEVLFDPRTAGAQTGSLQITDDAPNNPQKVSLSGTGVVPTIKLVPDSLSFGDETIHVATAARKVTLTNTSSVTLSISNITAPNGYIETNDCGVVSAQSSCMISVVFKPTVVGLQNGALKISDNGQGSPQTVALSGTGTAQ